MAPLTLGHCLGRLFGDTPTGRTVLDMSYQRLDPDYFGLGIQRGALMGLLWQRPQQLGVPWHRVLRWMALRGRERRHPALCQTSPGACTPCGLDPRQRQFRACAAR